jgi:hypothetical protein
MLNPDPLAFESEEIPLKEKYYEILRNLTAEQKLMRVFELNKQGELLLKQQLRKKHPGKSEEEIQVLYIERLKRCHNLHY